MKVALVHDYLSQDGGAEQVLKAFHEVWPEAPIFVLFHDRKKVSGFDNANLKQSFIGRLPLHKKYYKLYLPWMPLATERHDLHDFDVVLSSTSAFAKGLITLPDTIHISYCHTPTRYLWTDTHEYIRDLKFSWILKAILPKMIHKLRIWDKMSVDRVDHFIANSGTVNKRIKKYYRRSSDIIYPPVDTERFFISKDVQDYFVSGGRLVPYKRFDLLVQTFNRLKTPLKIFGTGPELEKLKKIAKPNIEFLGRISDQEKSRLLSQAKAFIHPQVEDFGITPIESMISGRPVIAYPVGGAGETVIPGETGLFFREQSWESLLDAVINFDKYNWNSEKIRDHARRYGLNIFKRRIKKYVLEKHNSHKQKLQQCKLDVR
jgi:glycosyltransferase involved in cell wall biosynthesis